MACVGYGVRGRRGTRFKVLLWATDDVRLRRELKGAAGAGGTLQQCLWLCFTVSRIAITLAAQKACEAGGTLEQSMLEVYHVMKRDPSASETVDLSDPVLLRSQLNVRERTR